VGNGQKFYILTGLMIPKLCQELSTYDSLMTFELTEYQQSLQARNQIEMNNLIWSWVIFFS